MSSAFSRFFLDGRSCIFLGIVKKKNPHAQALGKLGGKKGGKARSEKLSPEHRREIAAKAARARWDKARNRKTS
ncbi:MAG: hypothetical protein DMG55_25910 [Acidobacteria bacterium]|jgi:hypothetical protein|nr:MAG: hypothetical protein DMG55_25910 [Acidobacteriota bacterium]